MFKIKVIGRECRLTKAGATLRKKRCSPPLLLLCWVLVLLGKQICVQMYTVIH